MVYATLRHIYVHYTLAFLKFPLTLRTTHAGILSKYFTSKHLLTFFIQIYNHLYSFYVIISLSHTFCEVGISQFDCYLLCQVQVHVFYPSASAFLVTVVEMWNPQLAPYFHQYQTVLNFPRFFPFATFWEYVVCGPFVYAQPSSCLVDSRMIVDSLNFKQEMTPTLLRNLCVMSIRACAQHPFSTPAFRTLYARYPQHSVQYTLCNVPTHFLWKLLSAECTHVHDQSISINNPFTPRPIFVNKTTAYF